MSTHENGDHPAYYLNYDSMGKVQLTEHTNNLKSHQKQADNLRKEIKSGKTEK